MRASSLAAPLIAVAAVLLTLAGVEVWVRTQMYRDVPLVLSPFAGLIYEMPRGDGTHNASGFRGPDYTNEPSPGVCRIIVAGDSVAYGGGIHDESKTFVRVFESQLNASLIEGPATASPVARYEVLNAAVPGYNIEQVSALYHHRLARLPHRVLLYAFFPNDLGASSGLLKHPGASDEVVLAMMPHAHQLWSPPLPGALDVMLSLHSRAYLYLRTRLYLTFEPRAAERRSAQQRDYRREQISKRLFHRFVREVQYGGHAMAMAVLTTHAVSHANCDDEVLAGQTQRCANAARAGDTAIEWAGMLGVPVVDLRDALREPAGFDYRLSDSPADYMHPNEVGHARLGRALFEAWQAQAMSRLCIASDEGR